MAEAVFAMIGHEGGQVAVAFSRTPEFNAPVAIDRWIMDPVECLEITEAMATAAFEARDGVKPVSSALKAELVEKHRMKLTARVAVMLGTLREDKTRSNGRVAQDVVDACLLEIFG